MVIQPCCGGHRPPGCALRFVDARCGFECATSMADVAAVADVADVSGAD